MPINLRCVTPITILLALGGPARADVITDWNEKAVAFVTKQRMLPPQAERIVASVHVAMFDAVNSIEHRYKPYRFAVTTTRDLFSTVSAVAIAATPEENTRPCSVPS